ncbi:MAG: AI-2E family transporter [Clostridia bacterium]|nr:AI-2E family transporter [Clostridia bacterium]
MKFRWKTALKIGACILLFYLLIYYWGNIAGFLSALWGAITPLLIGGIIAYLVNIPMRFFERHYFPKSTKKFVLKTRRFVCMLVSFVVLLGVVGIIIRLVVPEFISCIELLLAKLPDAMSGIVAHLNDLHVLPGEIAASLSEVDWKASVKSVLDVLSHGAISDVLGTVVNLVMSVFSGIFTGFLSIIFAFYILMGKERIGGQFRRLYERYLRPAWQEKIMNFLRTMDDCFRRFIIGQVLDAVLVGVLCTIGMMIFGMPYATMIGALVAITALIPVVGAWIGAIVGAFMILTVSPIQALLFLVFLIVLQQLEGNLVYPRIVGDAIGLPGIWVLAAVTIGGGVAGVGGMLIGVPLAATIYRLLKKDVEKGKKVVTKAEENPSPPQEETK